MQYKKLIKILGPGLLYAGAAVGVSHLVQSTRAGAGYGFDLLWILILANIIKYPFFEFGARYASSTGKSLIDGYNQIGKWAVALFAVLTVATMFSIQAAVTIVTSGLVANVFMISIDPVWLSAIILVVTMIVLMIGRYAVLDKLIKVVIVVLAVSTIIAVVSAFGKGFHPEPEFSKSFSWIHNIDIFFLIAFIGWMPAPIDVSVWQSLWTVAKRKNLGFIPKLKEALLDFKIGYIGTVFLAACYLTLGALVLYGTGEKLSPEGVIFAEQLISLFTSSIGQWAYYIIAIAAITTMFSTILTCLDAYPRVMKPMTEIFFPKAKKVKAKFDWESWMWIVIVVTGALVLLGFLSSSMHFMVDLATTLSFVTAPLLAFLNYKVVTDKHLPEEARPKSWLRVYAWTGIVFLTAFTVVYLVWKFVY
ncbi:MAG: Nramp family divalent metal transporter [Bacteroidetes bacterium]|nr:Nramp family divalent metal transporter [Bacteroidota bacterium]MBL7104924.1 Nramp family divalent metal transporter [Bacteroidales bacterium]